MKVRERCQCGAEFEADDGQINPPGAQQAMTELIEWRENHSCTALRAETRGTGTQGSLGPGFTCPKCHHVWRLVWDKKAKTQVLLGCGCYGSPQAA